MSRELAGSGIAVGAQNVHSESAGAFTGEISAEMVREFASLRDCGPLGAQDDLLVKGMNS